MIYRPTGGTGGRVKLETPFPRSNLHRDWVCWQCEESTPAEGPTLEKKGVDQFFNDHKECDRDPYIDEYPVH